MGNGNRYADYCLDQTVIKNIEIKRAFFLDKKKPIVECTHEEVKERIEQAIETIKVLMTEKKPKRRKKKEIDEDESE